MILDDMKLFFASWKIVKAKLLKFSQKQPVRYIVIRETPSINGVFWNYEILLTLSWRRPLSYRNQSKSMDWFLYDNGLRHERVKLHTMYDLIEDLEFL